MTQLSSLGYYVKGLVNYDGAGANKLNAEYPVSTNEAVYVMNNAQHLYDESTQYRVNWCVPSLTKAITETGTVQNQYFHLVSHIFPLSYNYAGRYPEALVVRVAGAVSTSEGDPYTGNIAVVLCSAYQPISPNDVYTGHYWAKLTDTTTSTAGEWIIEDIMDDYTIATPISYDASCQYANGMQDPTDSNFYNMRMRLGRLSVYGYVTDNLVPLYIIGISAREFRKTLT